MARDLAHSRPHLDKSKKPKKPLEQYNQRLKKSIKSLDELGRGTGSVSIQKGDARQLALANDSVDLVVTSPPYANAIDYMRAHKFSLVWLGASVSDLSVLRSTYIGSEKVARSIYAPLPPRLETVLGELTQKDAGKAGVLRKYFVEMQEAIREMYRVLKPNASAVIVIGSSTMRGMDVQTHACLADLSAAAGFDVVGVMPRQLNETKK